MQPASWTFLGFSLTITTTTTTKYLPLLPFLHNGALAVLSAWLSIKPAPRKHPKFSFRMDFLSSVAGEGVPHPSAPHILQGNICLIISGESDEKLGAPNYIYLSVKKKKGHIYLIEIPNQYPSAALRFFCSLSLLIVSEVTK